MLVFRFANHKMLVRIANRENPDQTASKQSDLGLSCLTGPFLQATSVRKIENICCNQAT